MVHLLARGVFSPENISMKKLLVALSLLVFGLSAIATAQTTNLVLTSSTIAGTPDTRGSTNATGAAARFYGPSGILVHSDGNLYVADAVNSTIRKVTLAGVVTTIAGKPIDPVTGLSNTGSADGTGSAASFNFGMAIASDGLFGPPVFTQIGATGIAADASGNIFVADSENHTIRKVTTAGVVTTFAGSPGNDGSANGTGGAARFYQPYSVTLDRAGNVFVVDGANYTIRKITPAGVVTTFAGVARKSGSTDGTGAVALFSNPKGIAIDRSDNLYVADTGNNTIRVITPSGSVSTLAGTVGLYGSSDGTGKNARFNGPTGLAVDAAGNVYVADTGNNTIRLITPAGVVRTVAGLSGAPASAEGTGNAIRFNQPYGLALDNAGNLYVADTNNNTIRKCVPATAASAATIQITSQPLRQFASVGQSVPFAVTATSTGAISYQWQKNGVDIPGATGSTFSISFVQLSDRATYTVNVTSLSVTVTSNSADLQVFAAGTPIPAITILTQPADQTVRAGESVTLAVEATSNPLPTFQWRKGTVNIPGATGFTYTIAAAQASDAGKYSVVISKPGATLTSEEATLTVDSSGAGNVAPTIQTQPAAVSASAGTTAIFTVVASGTPTPTYQWKKDGTALANGTSIAGVTTSALTLTGVTAASAGSYTVTITNSIGSITSNGVALTVNAASVAPTIQTQPAAVTAAAGTTASFTVVASGTPTPTYLWKKDGNALADSSAISGSTTSALTLTGITAASAGSYSVTITNSIGSITSNGAALTVTPIVTASSKIINLSIRSNAGTGAQTLIAGFVTSGGPKTLIVRGVGPTLGIFGVAGALASPQLSVFSGNSVTASNAGWSDAANAAQIATTSAAVGAFALPSGSLDSAILTTLPAGPYSAQILGANGTTGIALAEVYDADPAGSASRLTNVSARTQVGTGAGILIAGFVISGNAPKTVLIRGVGPTLGLFGVTGVLADPRLALFSGSTQTATNAGWGTASNAAQIATTAASVGAFALPANSADSVILVTLQPGTYSAQVSSVSGATGIGLVEVYEVP